MTILNCALLIWKTLISLNGLLDLAVKLKVFEFLPEAKNVPLGAKRKRGHCTDVNGLVNAMGCNYIANEWRLFIDASKKVLKQYFYITPTNLDLYH